MGQSRQGEGEGHIKKNRVQTKPDSKTKEIEAGPERDKDKKTVIGEGQTKNKSFRQWPREQRGREITEWRAEQEAVKKETKP